MSKKTPAATQTTEGQIDVTVTKKANGGEIALKNETEQIGEPVTTFGAPAEVSYRGRRTKNLGNFESISIEVGITLPCDPSDTARAYEEAKAFVGTRMKAELSFAAPKQQG